MTTNPKRRNPRTLAGVLHAWNDATRPDLARTEHQHRRQAQRAAAIDRALVARGWQYGRDWHYNSADMRVPRLKQQSLI